MVEQPTNGDLRPEEAHALRDVGGEVTPAAELEAKTIRALRDRGLLRSADAIDRRRSRSWAVAGVAAAAVAVVAFVVGLAVGSRVSGPMEPVTAGSGFVLFLLEGAGYSAPGPGEARARVREYGRWAVALREEERLVMAEELAAEGGVLLGPDGETRDIDELAAAAVGGVFVIVADDYAHAVELARGSPHLRYGGRIAIVRIQSS